MNLKQYTTALLALLLAAFTAHAQIIIKNGEKVAFLGDSITQQGWSRPHGYVKLVLWALESNGVKVMPIPAGVGGNTSNDMLARIKRDVLDKKPDWVTISCGMNDVIHGPKGVPLDQYKTNMTSIVDQCQAAGIKVIIFTTTTAFGKTSPQTKTLGEYNAFLQELAKARKCPVVDLFTAFMADSPHGLTIDGVHMSPYGNILMAKTILKSVGMADAQIAKMEDQWMDAPGFGDFDARVDIVLNVKFMDVKTPPLTLRQLDKIDAAAKAARRPTRLHWSRELLLSLMKKKVKPAGPYDSLDALFEPGVKQKVEAELQNEFTAEVEKIVGKP